MPEIFRAYVFIRVGVLVIFLLSRAYVFIRVGVLVILSILLSVSVFIRVGVLVIACYRVLLS